MAWSGELKLLNQGLNMHLPRARTIFRWIHIIFGIPIVGYVYSPLDQIQAYASPVRFIFVPVLLASGLWMWKGHWVRRLFSKGSAHGVELNR